MDRFNDRQLELLISAVRRALHATRDAELLVMVKYPGLIHPYTEEVAVYKTIQMQLLEELIGRRETKSPSLSTDLCEHRNVPADCPICNPILQPETENDNVATPLPVSLEGKPAGKGAQDQAH